MRRWLLAPVVAVIAALAVLPAPAPGQTLTRVTDPNNPIVTDMLESGGGSWIDLKGDGRLDLFVPHGNLSTQHSALYRNDRAGGFVRVSTGPIAADQGRGIGGTFGDFDNDGFADLFVTNRNNNGNFLYRGLGDTAFVKVTTGSPVTDIANSNSSSWVDLDRDGVLDLYVVNFQGNDFLYRCGGPPAFDFTRLDTTAATPGTEFSIPGAWADVNDDGLDDLFVGNAGTQTDYLFTNLGNFTFARALLGDNSSTLGGSWGDYDNDGHLDLIVTCYSGQRCILYHNSGPPTFALTPQDTSGVTAATGSWVGSGWGDYDNDGNLDLFVANDGPAGALYHNAGAPGYGLVRVTTGDIATDAGNAFGCVWGDYDRDGALDLFVAHRANQRDFLYHNSGNANHWITVRCMGTRSNRSAIGAKVRVRATIDGTPHWQLREVTGQTGYNSQNLDQHFGLGDAATIDSLRIDWPSGTTDVWTDVPADTLRLFVERTSPLGVPPVTPAADLGIQAVRPNPSAGASRLAFFLPASGRVRVELFDLAGRRVMTALDADLAAGAHAVDLRAPGSRPGVYLARLVWQGEARVTRVAFVR